MIAECYDLTLQCDFHPYPEVYRGTFTGASRTDCWRQARAAGWRLYDAQHLAKCKFCAAAGRTGKTIWPVAEEPERSTPSPAGAQPNAPIK